MFSMQDLSDSQNNDVHNVIHTMQSVPIHSDTSVDSNADYASIAQEKQCLQECKPPPNLQPMLVNQTKSILDGNKNKTDCLDWASHSIEQDDNMSNQNTMVDLVNILSPADWSGDHSKYRTLGSVWLMLYHQMRADPWLH